MKNIRIYLLFALLAAAMLILFPKEGKFPYEYQKGRPWIYETLISPIDFPLLKSEAEMLKEKEEKSEHLIDYYNYDQSVAKLQIERFYADASNRSIEKKVSSYIVSNLDEAYRRGLMSVKSTDDSFDNVIGIKRDKRLSEVPATEVYDIASLHEMLRSDIGYRFPDEALDSLLHGLDLKEYLVPNLIFDETFTELAHREAVDFISPTKGIVYAGQLIVSKGEIVTSDICSMLDSYKAEYKLSFGYQGSSFSQWASHLILVLAMVMLMFFVLYFLEENVLDDTRKLTFFLLIMFLSFIATTITFSVSPGHMYIVPYAVLALFIGAFFKRSVVAATYTVSLLPLLLIPENGIELFMINMTAGAVLQFSYQRFNRGWLQFVNIIFIFAAMGAVYSSFHIAKSEAVFFSERELLLIAVNALLVVMLYPFVYLIEKIFSFVSYTRLWELSDTNNKLLIALQRKAPGTFQHSLQVANLAENAARSIGADSMLVRVGALYHDIGKGENPMCFVENQAAGVNYHQGLTPEESASAIIHHVDAGMAMAEKAGLPGIVKDFILSHHGTSVTGYFFNVYCNNGGDPADKAAFTYNGRKPHSKEEAILMVADSVEAAARTLTTYSEQTVSELVDKIVSSKIPQLDECDISIKEIETVKDGFKKYLMQIYHARIAYPKRKLPQA